MKTYEVSSNDTIKSMTKKEIVETLGFKENLRNVESIHISGNNLYVVKPNKTVAYKKVYGTWAFSTKI